MRACAIHAPGSGSLLVAWVVASLGCSAPLAEHALEAAQPHRLEPASDPALDAVLVAPHTPFVLRGTRAESTDGLLGVGVAEEGATLSIAHARGRAEIELVGAPARQAVRVDPSGAAIRELPGDIEERFTLGPHGLEQSWLVSTPIDELRVETEVRHAHYVARTASGLHFRADDQSVGFVYSDGVLIDADGRRTPIEARWVDGRIRLDVPPAVLARATFPVLLDPTIGVETEVDAPLVVPHRTSQYPVLRFDGSRHWALYSDHGRPSTSLRLTRIDSTGAVVDPYGIVIHESPAVGRFDLAVTPAQALSVWDSTALPAPGVYARRVSSTGAVLDASAIPVATGSPFATPIEFGPVVATNGSGFLVVWTVYGRVLAARLSASGAVLDAPPLTLEDGVSEPAGQIDATYVNGRYVIVYTVLVSGSVNLIRAVRVTSDGAVLDAPSRVVYSDPIGSVSVPKVVASGTGAVLAWIRRTSDMGPTPTLPDAFAAARFDDGASLAVGPVVTFGAPSPNIDLREPVIASDGTRTVVTWHERSVPGDGMDVHGVRLSPTGALLDPTPFVIDAGPGDQRTPAASVSPSGFLIAWTPLERVVVARRMSAAGTWTDPAPFPLSFASHPQEGPRSTFGASRYLVAWTDHRSYATTFTDVYAARVSPTGAIMDPVAIPVATTVEREVLCDVVWDGRHFWVLYSSDDPVTSSDIHARRVSEDGTFPDTAPFALVVRPEHQSRCRANFDGSALLVSWMDGPTGGGLAHRVLGQRFDRDGSAIGSEIVVHGIARNISIAAAYTAGVHYIGFNYRPVASATDAVGMIRVRADGTVLDSSAVSLAGRSGPVLVADATGVIALSEHTGATSTKFLYSARIGPSGAAVRQTVRTTTGDQVWLAATFDGVEYYGLAREPSAVPSSEYAVRFFAVPLTAGGMVAGPELDVMRVEHSFTRAHLSSGGGGRALLAYDRLVVPAPYGSNRAFVRILGGEGGELGQPCGADSECSSGHCADGLCCDSPCGGSRTTDCQACSVARGAAVNGRCSVLTPGTVCNPSRGDCDVSEACDGASAECPADALASSGAICRPAGNACDAEEACDGVTDACPEDETLPDGTRCGDDRACEGVATCSAGACAPGTPLLCDDLDECTTDSCAEPVGCVFTVLPGCRDAGPHDAGAPDGGLADAGAADAGATRSDAGSSDAGPATDDGGAGCGCRAVGDRGGSLWWLLGGVVLALRRRRERLRWRGRVDARSLSGS